MRKRLRKKLTKQWMGFSELLSTAHGNYIVSGWTRGPLSINRKGQRRVNLVTGSPLRSYIDFACGFSETKPRRPFGEFDDLRVVQTGLPKLVCTMETL